MWIYYIISIEKQVHVSVRFCGHIQEGIFRKKQHYKDNQTDVLIWKVKLSSLIFVFEGHAMARAFCRRSLTA
jgi:hypothetical protein